MKVLHGDKVKVRASNGLPQVLMFADIGDRAGVLMLDAKQARRLARKINMAASAIEIRELQGEGVHR